MIGMTKPLIVDLLWGVKMGLFAFAPFHISVVQIFDSKHTFFGNEKNLYIHVVSYEYKDFILFKFASKYYPGIVIRANTQVFSMFRYSRYLTTLIPFNFVF